MSQRDYLIWQVRKLNLFEVIICRIPEIANLPKSKKWKFKLLFYNLYFRLRYFFNWARTYNFIIKNDLPLDSDKS